MLSGLQRPTQRGIRKDAVLMPSVEHRSLWKRTKVNTFSLTARWRMTAQQALKLESTLAEEVKELEQEREYLNGLQDGAEKDAVREACEQSARALTTPVA